ncbi:hypothetical protein SLS60_000755 [Paraconiothyrium brasiliense]|uniref:Peptidase M20 dimerisation domain-containing protein n=1 Tax=Paraconiothyrium brasiliense TaxID=300254 RepID=A0ABR3S7P7_9PLEO
MGSISDILASKVLNLKPYEVLYKHYHANPELSNQEEETAATTAKQLSKLSVFEITTNIGGHGLAGVFRNGSGPTVLLRADMDALPVKELTNLPYASTVTQISQRTGEESHVMHACGHDFHIVCLLAAAEHLCALRSSWSGTFVVLFQPAEERGTGAQAMVDDGLYDPNKHNIPVPDYVLGQHVMALPAGKIGSRVGTIMAAADSFKVTVFGRGGHGSMPNRTIDPVMMASNIVVRLQNIVSRETDPSDMAVVTVGYLKGGHTENIIVDHAELGIDIRTINKTTRDRVIASIKRVVHAEYIAAGAPKEPTIEETRSFPATDNDEDMEKKLASSFEGFFGHAFDPQIERTNASEDVSILATSQGKPSLFWFFGGCDPELYAQKEREGRLIEDIPQNHSSGFAPVIQPTLKTGVDALCVAALTFLARK